MSKGETPNDKGENFRDERTGKLVLVRCYICNPDVGVENWAPAASAGQCAWCGWKEGDRSTSDPGR